MSAFTDYLELLKLLISTPSLSQEESKTADLIENFIQTKGVIPFRNNNNVWAFNKSFRADQPTIFLNSHHDTVKPSDKWHRNPFGPVVENGKLYGLGSNDAGGALVALLATFMYFNDQPNLNYNLIFAATAEEEISGKAGVASILPELGKIHLGIVGEPTLMQMAIAEKGLLVLDCVAEGISGHAARDEGINAIYQALPDLQWFQTYEFPKISEWLGKVKMTVTQITAGSQHNVVPDTCQFVVDVRTNENYNNQEIFEIIKKQVKCTVSARSFRLNSSRISINHPVVVKGLKSGLSCYGSPTLSDQSLMNFPTLKIGPGDSARSHTADEFIYLHEIEDGIRTYIEVLTDLDLSSCI